LIDLHTHTTASDGRCSPAELVRRAAAAGVHVLGVTDHDTLAGCDAAAEACIATRLAFVPGIEITAVTSDRDVHVLGYFIDPRSPSLLDFLEEMRRGRVERLRLTVDRLRRLGIRLDADAILQPAVDDPARAVGRPWIARALVQDGHVRDVNEAFDRWLARGRPAFVPRSGVRPEEVFARIHAAGGVASLAHPALNACDKMISGFATSGLDAIEAYHPEHDGPTTVRYLSLAAQLGLGISGGSDYHGDSAHGSSAPGSVSLPPEHYDRLLALRR
jgi:predicted metal-dependent phosphoesterase TrpH